MNFCVLVENDKILQTAMDLVRHAKKLIVVTMDLDEELLHPLPKAYHKLFMQRQKDGICAVRYGFGTKRTFAAIRKKHKEIPCIYAGSIMSYQRMLVVDHVHALFQLREEVYETDFAPLAVALENYIQTVYNKEHI